MTEVFASSLGLVISPYVEIEDEVRVILLDGQPMLVYRKQRPQVVGDGVHTLRELATAAGHDRGLSELGTREVNAVVPKGEQRILNWRHNLDAGAKPVLWRTARSERPAQSSRRSRDAIGITFASIDVVRVDGEWRVLEINSGVMMEALAKLHPELVQATYDAALDRVFGNKG